MKPCLTANVASHALEKHTPDHVFAEPDTLSINLKTVIGIDTVYAIEVMATSSQRTLNTFPKEVMAVRVLAVTTAN